MADYHVVVGVSRTSFLGVGETRSKAYRIEAPDPVTAGERGLDTMVVGPGWRYASVEAKVLSLETGEVVSSMRMHDVKAFGTRRRETDARWTPRVGASSRTGDSDRL